MDHHPQHGPAQRRHHQGAVQRPVHRPGHRPHHDRHGPGPPADQTPQRRLLEGWRPGARAAPVPAAEPREDRRLGRLRRHETRHPVHPAGPGTDLPGPQAQRQHHRRARLRQRGEHARSRPAPGLRYRCRQPEGLHLRADRLRAVRHRRRRPGAPEPLRPVRVRRHAEPTQHPQHRAQALRPEPQGPCRRAAPG
ncbi:hypothetical protein D9M68_715870 [compost metagenome]